MLSGALAAIALAALVAGIAGAWSPCGFSMVDTIGTALGDVRRATMTLASATFTLGALAGGAVTFGGLALLGSLLGGGASGVRDAIAAALALAAAAADWRGLRIAPQIRRQVPERWRWIMPLPLACALYGVLLGLGFTTFVLSFAVWALAGMSFASGSLSFGLVAGIAFGVGRALPVLWIAPRLGREDGQRALDRLALEPRLWLGLRRVDAIALSFGALLLGAAAATAAPPAQFAHLGTDPSTAGRALAWERPTTGGWLVRPAGTARIPGRFPALGGGRIAWVAADGAITVATRFPAPHPRTFAAPASASIDDLAVSRHWLVVRDQGSGGVANLFAISLAHPKRRVYLQGAGLPGAIGRPSLSGSRVVWTYSDAVRSTLYEANLATGARRILLRSARNVLYANPSLAGGRLLYERSDRCVQDVLLGSSAAPAHARVILALPSIVTRDPGYQPGYVQDYNTASLCHNRKTGPGGTMTLGPTALGIATAWVSESPPALAATRIVAVAI
ncbi:MAG TPA: hypothetical protein VHX66_06580 [Solirubrobacteraceae bacterium]|nr:hypothetical protein [Solirubrobacteraceae bacterium]